MRPQSETTARNALFHRARFARGTQAGVVTHAHDYLYAVQCQFGQPILGQCTNGCSCRAAALIRRTHPVAEIAETMQTVYMIKPAAANKDARVGIEDSELEGAALFPPLLAEAAQSSASPSE